MGWRQFLLFLASGAGARIHIDTTLIILVVKVILKMHRIVLRLNDHQGWQVMRVDDVVRRQERGTEYHLGRRHLVVCDRANAEIAILIFRWIGDYLDQEITRMNLHSFVPCDCVLLEDVLRRTDIESKLEWREFLGQPIARPTLHQN